MDKFWNWMQPSDDGEVTVLELDGEIASETWFGDECTPQAFKEELENINGDIEVYINSPGGDCIAASEIYTMLKEHNGKVTVKIDALAASAASVIAMAGDEVLMAPTAMLMIHNPATMAFGDHNDMEHAIDVLKEFKESIINAYVLKTGQCRKKISDMMDAETWMNAKTAIDLGFADGLIGDKENTGRALLFSAQTAKLSLVNKINETKSENVEEHTGRNSDVLKRKLNISKNKYKDIHD